MSYRAAIILIQDDRVALIERHRQGLHYFTLPGGHVDEGETPEQAAVREAYEELGLHVIPIRLVAQIGWRGHWQYYYLGEIVGGEFGSGTGEEILTPHPEKGSYHPVWMPISELPHQPVKPPEIVPLLLRALQEGWPTEVLVIPENA
ncbi:MAG: NUDIX domain-containing protein [Anaerolineales bacterium]|nr:NUDIX domain-containing protein [Anaerolineales bacterium]MCX7608332.1 NUDIX domain-containing protein [Anaerolineales bacterium]